MKKSVVIREISQDTCRNFMVMMLCGHRVDFGVGNSSGKCDSKSILRFGLVLLPRLTHIGIPLSLAVH